MGARARHSRTATIEAHLPLVRAIARRYAGRGEPFDDLVQAGTIGLIKAVDRYDPARHPDLAALARPSIEGEIRHHLRDAGPGPHVPRTDRELAAGLRAVRRELTAKLRREPTAAELAAATGVDERRAAGTLQAVDAGRPVALDADAEIPAVGRTSSDVEAAEARVLIEAGWAMLDDRERRMLELRYHEGRSQSEIARELELSQGHVSRLLRDALERLRAAIEAPPDPHAGRHDEDDVATTATDSGAPRAAGRDGRVLLPVPHALRRDLASAAARAGVPLDAYVAERLRAALEADAAQRPGAGASRVLVVNAVVIALAALAGLALLLQAWLG